MPNIAILAKHYNQMILLQSTKIRWNVQRVLVMWLRDSAIEQIRNYASINVREEVFGPNFHSVQNIMTLDLTFHGRFDHLQAWFDEDPVGFTFSM